MCISWCTATTGRPRGRPRPGDISYKVPVSLSFLLVSIERCSPAELWSWLSFDLYHLDSLSVHGCSMEQLRSAVVSPWSLSMCPNHECPFLQKVRGLREENKRLDYLTGKSHWDDAGHSSIENFFKRKAQRNIFQDLCWLLVWEATIWIFLAKESSLISIGKEKNVFIHRMVWMEGWRNRSDIKVKM